jgi:protoheme IX farnesyltransferase
LATPLRTFASLTKFPISALSTLTAATGYICAARTADAGIISTSAGVLLLAFGACALNQFQERRLDALMPRTWNRPIPAGLIAPSFALALAVLLSVAGFWTLLLYRGILPALLGLSALVWYNGVYTYLKRFTAFAVVPGALVGAIPPFLGWAAGGGEILAPQSLVLAFFFLLWQVPHFWLLVAIHGPEYESVGLPSLTGILPPAALARLTFAWTCAAAFSALLLPVFRATSGRLTMFLLTVAGCALFALSLAVLRPTSANFTRRSFLAINLYALVICGLLASDPLIVRMGW